MGIVRKIGSAVGWGSRKVAMRSRWLARRLWIVAAADVALASRSHWKRLDDEEQHRLLEITRKWRGKNSNLSEQEKREAEQLLNKLGHIELAGTAAGIVLPFRPLSRLATKLVERRYGAKEGSEFESAAASSNGAPQPQPAAQAGWRE
jgi:hypothetical protein